MWFLLYLEKLGIKLCKNLISKSIGSVLGTAEIKIKTVPKKVHRKSKSTSSDRGKNGKHRNSN